MVSPVYLYSSPDNLRLSPKVLLMSYSPKCHTITLNPTLDRTLYLPSLERGAVNRVEETRIDSGGKGINVSRALALWGKENTIHGFLGNTQQTLFLEALEALPFTTLEFTKVEGTLRICTKVVEANGDTTDLNEKGITPSEESLTTLANHLALLVKEGDLVLIGGSLPPNAPRDYYAHLITIVHEKGGVAWLDTSGATLQHTLDSVAPTFIKPNIHELESLIHETIAPEPKAIKLACQKASKAYHLPVVVCSMGGDGALLYLAKDDLAYFAKAPKIEVQSTVGAGDSMVAMFMASVQDKLPLKECFIRAVGTGSAAAALPGTTMPPIQAIEALIPFVRPTLITL